jgi:hypothetical protein
MRVNMDSSIVSDPRFEFVGEALSERLGLTEQDATDLLIGKCYRVWLVCYERRSATLTVREVDKAARMTGFAVALAAEGLADIDGDEVFLHGVDARIDFLERQRANGSKGGRPPKPTEKPPGKPTAKPTAKPTEKPPTKPTPKAYSLDHDQDQDQDHTQAPNDDVVDDDVKAQNEMTSGDLVAEVQKWDDWPTFTGLKRPIRERLSALTPVTREELADAKLATEAVDGNPNVGLLVAKLEQGRKQANRARAGPAPPRDPRYGYHPGSDPSSFRDGDQVLRWSR